MLDVCRVYCLLFWDDRLGGWFGRLKNSYVPSKGCSKVCVRIFDRKLVHFYVFLLRARPQIAFDLFYMSDWIICNLGFSARSFGELFNLLSGQFSNNFPAEILLKNSSKPLSPPQPTLLTPLDCF